LLAHELSDYRISTANCKSADEKRNGREEAQKSAKGEIFPFALFVPFAAIPN
jgi:hypothetical protein